MAQYPCDAHGARYQGPQRTAYPALIDGGETKRERRRMCSPCFSALRVWLVEHAGLASADWNPYTCQLCGSESCPVAMFVTLYDHGEEREDWYSRFCAECGAGPAAMALFGTQSHLPGM